MPIHVQLFTANRGLGVIDIVSGARVTHHEWQASLDHCDSALVNLFLSNHFIQFFLRRRTIQVYVCVLLVYPVATRFSVSYLSLSESQSRYSWLGYRHGKRTMNEMNNWFI